MYPAKYPSAFSANADGCVASFPRVVFFLLLLLLPMAAIGDGMVVPSTAYPAAVTIPDQRALICFSNGTERLVIETRFTGAGTNFAWVVPLPGNPVVEEATTGLFPTLQFLFRPQFITDVPHYFAWISGLIWIGYVLMYVRPNGRMSRLDIASCLLVAVCIASTPGSVHLPQGVWLALGTFTFICLIFILALARHWRADMYGLAVVLLALFIALQLVVAFSYVTSYPAEPFQEQSVFVFLFGCDLILIIALFMFKAARIVCAVLLVFAMLFVAAGLLPVAATSRSSGLSSLTMPDQAVSILQREIVGVFDTTTVASSDPTALQKWLADNGYSVPENAGPVIADYVKDGWVFVATKIRSDEIGSKTLTPHPLSFTFATDKPVYPMRLTGLANKTLSVDLYVFSNMRAAAPHFRTESCTQPVIAHPLLAKWTAGLPVATKLSANLSANDMRRDVWLNQSSFGSKQPNRLYSRPAAWTLALNCGAGFLAIGLAAACLIGSRSSRYKDKIPAIVRAVIIASVALIGLSYVTVPQTSVTWVRGSGWELRREQSELLLGGLQEILPDNSQITLAEARAEVQNIFRSREYMRRWINPFTGEPIREEDSPGNYTIEQNSNELKLVIFDADGRPEVSDVGPVARRPSGQ